MAQERRGKRNYKQFTPRFVTPDTKPIDVESSGFMATEESYLDRDTIVNT